LDLRQAGRIGRLNRAWVMISLTREVNDPSFSGGDGGRSPRLSCREKRLKIRESPRCRKIISKDETGWTNTRHRPEAVDFKKVKFLARQLRGGGKVTERILDPVRWEK